VIAERGKDQRQTEDPEKMSPEVGPVENGHERGAGRGPRLPEPLSGTVLAALIAGGVLLRLAFLGADSFWLDEAYSVSNVLPHSVGEIWHTSVDPNHPSLYFVVLRLALGVGGVSETMARLPSAVASICSLALVYVLARRLGMSTRAGRAAVVLMAFAALDVWYAQEARMYAMVTTAALAFAVALTMDSWLAAVLASAALTIGLYVDFTTVALSAIVTSLWLVWWWHRSRQSSRVAGVAAAWIGAWLVFQPEWSHLGEVLRRIDTVPLLVNLHRWFGLKITSGAPAVVVVTLIAGVAAIVVAVAWRALRTEQFRHAWAWFVWAGFVGSTLALTVPRGYSAKQFLATGWPFVVLVVAWTLTDATEVSMPASSFTFRRSWRLSSAVVVSIVAAIITIATPRADWRGAVRYLNERTPRTAGVWIDPPWNTVAYDFYHPTLVAGTNLLQSSEAATGRVGNRGEVCFVAERFGGRPPTSPSEAWLDRHLALIEKFPVARLEVRCYR
jgi:uncharacterized membrane protein